MKVKFTVKTDGLDAIDHKLAALASKAEITLATQIKKDTEQFVPKLTGSQIDRTYVEGNMIVYDGPYARYLYYGKAVAGPPSGPKHATDKDLVYTPRSGANPQSHWFEASKAQNLDKWLRVAEKAIKEK